MDTQRKSFQAEMVRLPDLTVASREIRDCAFTNCVIMGPAVVALMGSVVEGCTFDGDLDAMLWELPEDRKGVIGAIGLVNCLFRGCRFIEVGFAGPASFIEQFKQGVAA